MRPTPTRAGSLLLLLLAMLMVYHPALRPGRTFAGMDFLNLLLPHAQLVRGSFAAGEWPLWNPTSWGGVPFLASMQTGALYPLMWPFLPFRLAAALPWFVMVHLVLAAGAAVFMARRILALGVWPSLLAGCAYAGGGFFLGHLEQVNTIAGIAWSAWVFAALLGIACGRQLSLLLGGSACMAVLAGHPQYLALALLFGYPAGLVLALVARRSVRGAAGFVLSSAPPLVMAAGAAAIQMLPAAELAGLSERVWPYPDPMNPALDLRHLAALVIPRYFNTLAGTPGQPIGYSETGLYAGILVALLALVGVARVLVRPRPAVVVVLVTALFALIFASGHQGGIAPLLSEHLPFLRNSRGAARALAIASLCYALLAGVGLDALLRLAMARVKWAAARRHLLGGAVVLVAAAELATVHAPEISNRMVDERLLEMPVGSAAALAGQPAPGRVHRFMAHDSDLYLDTRGDAVFQRRFRMQPNMNAPHGIAVLDGYEEGLLPPRHFANFLRRYNRNLRSDRPDAVLLALMGSNRVFTEYPITDMGPGWRRTPETLYFFGTTYRIWQSEMPSALFLDASPLAPAIAASDSPDSTWRPVGGITRPVREQTRTVAARHPADWVTSATLHAAARHGVSAVPTGMNRIECMAAADSPRRLLFLQSWYPGWKVVAESVVVSTPDQVAPIFSVINRPESPAFRMEYRPYSFRIGGFLSLAALMVAAAAILARPLRLRRTPSSLTGSQT